MSSRGDLQETGASRRHSIYRIHRLERCHRLTARAIAATTFFAIEIQLCHLCSCCPHHDVRKLPPRSAPSGGFQIVGKEGTRNLRERRRLNQNSIDAWLILDPIYKQQRSLSDSIHNAAPTLGVRRTSTLHLFSSPGSPRSFRSLPAPLD